MAKFDKLTSHLVPLPADNVDTDQIIPARFLKVIDKNGLGKSLFCDWRYLADGSPNPEFVLNEAASQGAQVLIAGDNFGSGSSREHAPWALMGWGFRAVISTSFADIFKGNSLKNGLLPVVVSADVHKRLMAAVQADRTTQVTIDLESLQLTLPWGESVAFPIDGFARKCLLAGVDQLGFILQFDAQISAWEQQAAAL